MYCLRRKERWEQCRPVFRALLSKQGFIDGIHKDTMLAHAWQETVANLLTCGPSDEDFASLVAKEIVKSAAGEDFSYSADHYIMPTLSILFNRYFQSTWPVIGAALISDDWMTTHFLTHVLGDLNDKVSRGLPPQMVRSESAQCFAYLGANYACHPQKRLFIGVASRCENAVGEFW
jgi:hypothetical protein